MNLGKQQKITPFPNFTGMALIEIIKFGTSS